MNQVTVSLQMTEHTPDSELSDRQAMFDVLGRLRAAMLQIVPTGTDMDTTPAHGAILSMFWRTVRHYDAIVLLLANNLPEEAAELSRPLYEESLKLRELGDDSGRRMALIAQHIQDSINEQRNLFDNRTDPNAQAKLDEVQKQLAEFAMRNGIGKFAEFLQEKPAAERFGRSADHDFYRFTHQFVHGSDIASTFGRDNSNGRLSIHDRTTTLWVQLGVALFASLSLVEATRGAAQVFGWQDVEALVAIQDELGAVQQRDAARREQAAK